jgi:hypothetical protein
VATRAWVVVATVWATGAVVAANASVAGAAAADSVWATVAVAVTRARVIGVVVAAMARVIGTATAVRVWATGAVVATTASVAGAAAAGSVWATVAVAVTRARVTGTAVAARVWVIGVVVAAMARVTGTATAVRVWATGAVVATTASVAGAAAVGSVWATVVAMAVPMAWLIGTAVAPRGWVTGVVVVGRFIGTAVAGRAGVAGAAGRAGVADNVAARVWEGTGDVAVARVLVVGSEAFAAPPGECVVALALPEVEGVAEATVVGARAGCAMAETLEVTAVVDAWGAEDEGDEEAVVGDACPEVVETDEPSIEFATAARAPVGPEFSGCVVLTPSAPAFAELKKVKRRTVTHTPSNASATKVALRTNESRSDRASSISLSRPPGVSVVIDSIPYRLVLATRNQAFLRKVLLLR